MLKTYQLKACNDLITYVNNKVLHGMNKAKTGYFRDNLFSDGAVVLAKIPGLSDDKRITITRSLKTGKPYIDRLVYDIKISDAETVRIVVTEEDLKPLKKYIQYVKLGNTDVAVSAYVLRRVVAIGNKEVILTIGKKDTDAIRFDNIKTGVRGYFTPVRFGDNIDDRVGTKLNINAYK